VHRALVGAKNIEQAVTISQCLATEIVRSRELGLAVTEQVV
jgi:hypothetical protein